MPQITGKAIIRVNGREWRAEDGASLDVGGEKRNPKVGGGKVHGFNKETVEPKMECKMFHTRDDDLLAIGKIEDATVIFECDTGDTYVLREAFVLEPAKLEAKDGTVSVSFSAISCERM
jgi:hypothetical protein